MMTASDDLIRCMDEILINLLYSQKNGIKLSSKQKNELQPYRRKMEKYILVKSLKKKRELLSARALQTIFTTILRIVKNLGIEH